MPANALERFAVTEDLSVVAWRTPTSQAMRTNRATGLEVEQKKGPGRPSEPGGSYFGLFSVPP